MSEGNLLLAAGALLAAGLAASLLAGRLRLPGLVLFLGLGMAIGSDGTGWIDFNDYELARRIGIVALVLILFEGGLAAGLPEIRPVLAPALSLAVVGTLVTAVITGLVAAALFDFSTTEGLLLGSVLAGTDGAAIFALLRGSTLRRRLARTLEGESGFNDPIAVLLVLGFIHWIQDPGYGVLDMAGLFARQIAIGGAAGLAVGWLAVQALRRLPLASPGLYPVASITAAALAFGLADSAHGSGFLATYLAGLLVGSGPVPARRTLTAFHDGVAWVAQITMFLVLGLLVFPGQLGDVALKGTLVALVIVLLARPVGAFAATVGFGYDLGERVLLGWAGLRGAVPVVLATFPVIAGVEHSREFFNIAFFAVLVSTVVQGVSFGPLAEALGLTTSEPALPPPLAETGTIRRLGAEVVEFPVRAGDAVVGCRVRDLGLPREALVNVIVRGEEALPPRGSTRVEAGDRLHVLVREEVAEQIPDLERRWRAGPIGPPPTPKPVPRGHPAVFSVRRWSEADGDAARPDRVLEVPVIDHLRTRRDERGALVLLADGRHAVTGPILAVGGRQDLQRYARTRLAKGRTQAAKAWWEEVIGALAR
jgi:potassium/hydrogen antiporter